MFETGQPVIIAQPATATEADLAIAYPGTAAAWEACAFNLTEVQRIIEGVKR